MRYAIVKSGIVANIVVADPDFAAQMGWVACPDEVGVEWHYDGKSFTPPPRSLEDLKQEKLNQVHAFFAHKLDAGVVFGGKVFQADALSQQRLVEAATWASIAPTSFPADFAWRAKDNTMQPVTSRQILLLAQEVLRRAWELRRAMWAHKDTIEKLSTAEEVEAYDITQGWPS